MEQETRARHSEPEDGRVDLARAIIFLAGMYCKLPGGGPDKALENNWCGGDLGDELCRNPLRNSAGILRFASYNTRRGSGEERAAILCDSVGGQGPEKGADSAAVHWDVRLLEVEWRAQDRWPTVASR